MATDKIADSLINHLTNITTAANKATARLASGKRINQASDDAAGLAVVQALEAEGRVLNRARLNADDGVGIANIAESTLSGVADITSRQAELAAQAANGTYSDDQRQALNAEYQALEQEKQRQLEAAEFNGMKIFNNNGTELQVGSDGSANSRVALPSVSTASISAGVADISNAANAKSALDDLQSKTSSISSLQGQIGAARNRVDYAANAASNAAVESAAAASRIRDIDVAEEAAHYTRLQIMKDTNTAMLAQANQNSNIVLNLLR